MSTDPQTELDHALLDKIELSPEGAVPGTPAYQDALKRLLAACQVYPHADHRGGYVTARSLASRPSFYAENLAAFLAGGIADDALESNASIYARYVRSLPEADRPRAEAQRVRVIGKAAQHRAKHGVVTVHDPLHTVFLVPGGGFRPGLPGNYLHGSVFHVGPDETTGRWVVQLHDSDDGAAEYSSPTLAGALEKMQEVVASAPFHLHETDGLDFRPL